MVRTSIQVDRELLLDLHDIKNDLRRGENPHATLEDALRCAIGAWRARKEAEWSAEPAPSADSP
jgi:hypothetical protein